MFYRRGQSRELVARPTAFSAPHLTVFGGGTTNAQDFGPGRRARGGGDRTVRPGGGAGASATQRHPPGDGGGHAQGRTPGGAGPRRHHPRRREHGVPHAPLPGDGTRAGRGLHAGGGGGGAGGGGG